MFAGRSTMASALLQKASAQLSGGHVTANRTSVNDDDDGLTVSSCCWLGMSVLCSI